MSGWARRRPLVMVVAGVAALGIALAGCSGTAGTTAKDGTGNKAAANQVDKVPPPKPVVLPATLTSSVQPAASAVPVDTAVSVTAANGTLSSVVFKGAGGATLAGTFNTARTTWTASEFLDPAVHYTLQSQAVNAHGKVTRSSQSFTTENLTLAQQTYPNVTPLQGQVMGVGMPVIVNFDVPVTNRAEVQKYMSVTSTPAQVGSWHWISDREVHWRPKTFWQSGTKVDVNLHLNGVNAGNGIYGQLDRHIQFTIGQSVVVQANLATDKMQVLLNGKVARTIPITGGAADGFQTRSGVKLISQKFSSLTMNSATIGIDPQSPNGYVIPDVQYAMRVTNSGEFLHAAPWSVYAQGHYNVSHGCVGMSTDNAQWLFDHAEIGTPVEVVGSTRELEANNGWTDWNESWTQYKAASAIK